MAAIVIHVLADGSTHLARPGAYVFLCGRSRSPELAGPQTSSCASCQNELVRIREASTHAAQRALLVA